LLEYPTYYKASIVGQFITMSLGVSIGDIILCTQIAYRIFTSVTKGRKQAPRDIKELEDVLFGLWCALGFLQREHEAVMVRATFRPDTVAAEMNQYLGYMIKSCQETLEELDNATANYRNVADHPGAAIPCQSMIADAPPSLRFRA
jgi:hypothetical protein